MDLAKRFSKVQLPGAKANVGRLPGAVMDEIFAKQQSYTPVAYINSPKRAGRKTVAFTESKGKARQSLGPKPVEDQVTTQKRAAATLIVGTFGGPRNAKTDETDIRVMLAKKSSPAKPTKIRPLPVKPAEEEKASESEVLPAITRPSGPPPLQRKLHITKLRNLMSKNLIAEHIS